MSEHDCGCLPVVQDQQSKRIIGTITDRDIACRCIAEARSADTPVGHVMSRNPSCCSSDDDLRDVERGVSESEVGRIVERVSEPMRKPRSTEASRPEAR